MSMSEENQQVQLESADSSPLSESPSESSAPKQKTAHLRGFLLPAR